LLVKSYYRALVLKSHEKLTKYLPYFRAVFIFFVTLFIADETVVYSSFGTVTDNDCPVGLAPVTAIYDDMTFGIHSMKHSTWKVGSPEDTHEVRRSGER